MRSEGGLAKVNNLCFSLQKIGVGEGFWGLRFELLLRPLLLRPPISASNPRAKNGRSVLFMYSYNIHVYISLCLYLSLSIYIYVWIHLFIF